MSRISIRAHAPGDLGSLARLMEELGYPTSPEEMSERLAQINPRGDYATFVAEAAGEIVGMVGAAVLPTYARNAPNGQIMALVVTPGFRGRGIGARLMAQAEAWLAGRNAARIVVVSGLRRPEAHAFYARLGYRETGRRFVKPIS